MEEERDCFLSRPSLIRHTGTPELQRCSARSKPPNECVYSHTIAGMQTACISPHHAFWDEFSRPKEEFTQGGVKRREDCTQHVFNGAVDALHKGSTAPALLHSTTSPDNATMHAMHYSNNPQQLCDAKKILHALFHHTCRTSKLTSALVPQFVTRAPRMAMYGTQSSCAQSRGRQRGRG